MRQTVLIILAISGLTLLGACAEQNSEQDIDLPAPESVSEQSTSPTDPVEVDMRSTLPENMTIEQAVTAARNDMARRMSVSAEEIDVIRSEAVTWGDGSLGCPEPGMMYTQALVPGFYIQLQHDGEDAYYHAGRSGEPMHCPSDRSSPPLDPDTF